MLLVKSSIKPFFSYKFLLVNLEAKKEIEYATALPQCHTVTVSLAVNTDPDLDSEALTGQTENNDSQLISVTHGS